MRDPLLVKIGTFLSIFFEKNQNLIGRRFLGRAPEGRAPAGRAPEGRAPADRAPEGRASWFLIPFPPLLWCMMLFAVATESTKLPRNL